MFDFKVFSSFFRARLWKSKRGERRGGWIKGTTEHISEGLLLWARIKCERIIPRKKSYLIKYLINFRVRLTSRHRTCTCWYRYHFIYFLLNVVSVCVFTQSTEDSDLTPPLKPEEETETTTTPEEQSSTTELAITDAGTRCFNMTTNLFTYSCTKLNFF